MCEDTKNCSLIGYAAGIFCISLLYLLKLFTIGITTSAAEISSDRISGPSIFMFEVSTIKQSAAHSRSRQTDCARDNGFLIFCVSVILKL